LMAKRKRSKTSKASDEEFQGPPPREATIIRTDRERQAEEELAEHTATSPRLSGGDIDADWQRADSVGEEAVGGSVATPDQDDVDELRRVRPVRGGTEAVRQVERRALVHDALRREERAELREPLGRVARFLGELALDRRLLALAGIDRPRGHLPVEVADDVTVLADQHHRLGIDEGQHADAGLALHDAVDRGAAVGQLCAVL